MAFLRHSTSKIQSVEDLFMVSSLGFRGEALSSIAAVAQVEVITRVQESITGTRYQIEGGQEKSLEEIGAPEGTTFIARNLFFNTPVRRKFLKTAMTEGSHVADMVEKIALSHPEVSIRLIQNNQNKLYTSGNHSLKDIIYTIYGREVAGNLLPVKLEHEAVRISGFIGKPVIARNNRAFENYFINGRFIRSNMICKAIEEAYKPFMMQHKYPFTMLHLTIEPEYLDVNVHPTKMELRFQNGELVFKLVREALSGALMHKELIPEVVLDEKKQKEEERQERKLNQEKRLPLPEPFERHRLAKEADVPVNLPKTSASKPGPSGSAWLRETPAAYDVKQPPAGTGVQTQPPAGAGVQTQPSDWTGVQTQPPAPADESHQSQQLDLFEERLLEPKSRSRHKLIGQLFDTYWLVEFKDQLYIIDQHAAHEKVLYEKTMATLKTRTYTSQMVNPPIILSLGSREEDLLKRNQKVFRDIGFEIEHFGGKEYAVRGVPDNLFSIAKKELLLDMLDNLADDTQVENPDLIYEKVASMSCKAAVKGNHAMSPAEADRLIDELLELENPYACPHGRPTIVSMSKYELEKKFKRIV